MPPAGFIRRTSYSSCACALCCACKLRARHRAEELRGIPPRRASVLQLRMEIGDCKEFRLGVENQSLRSRRSRPAVSVEIRNPSLTPTKPNRLIEIRPFYLLLCLTCSTPAFDFRLRRGNREFQVQLHVLG